MTPFRAVVVGAAAGVVGTAAMTAVQAAVAVRRGADLDEALASPEPESWQEAPAPGQVAQRVLAGVFKRPPGTDKAPLLTNLVHWGYGAGWGAVYGIAAGGGARNPLAGGTVFGSAVFGSAYVALPAMKIYDPPWEYEGSTLATDWGYHLVYGLGTALAFRLLTSGRR